MEIITNDDNMYNNPNQLVEVNAGAVTNPEGLMIVKPAVESLPDIKNPISEAEPTSVVEEKSKDEPLIVENSTIEPTSTEVEPKEDSVDYKEEKIEEELSEKEKENLAIMKALSDAYPHAFTREIDDKGREWSLFKGYDLDKEDHIIICQKGMIRLSDRSFNKNLEVMRDKLFSNFVFNDNSDIVSSVEPNSKETFMSFRIFDFKKVGGEGLKELKERFARYEYAHKNDVEPKEPTVDDVIKSLLPNAPSI